MIPAHIGPGAGLWHRAIEMSGGLKAIKESHTASLQNV